MKDKPGRAPRSVYRWNGRRSHDLIAWRRAVAATSANEAESKDGQDPATLLSDLVAPLEKLGAEIGELDTGKYHGAGRRSAGQIRPAFRPKSASES